MYISNISYFSKEPGYLEVEADSITRKTYCIYSVSFKSPILTGEKDFCFVDSIGNFSSN